MSALVPQPRTPDEPEDRDVAAEGEPLFRQEVMAENQSQWLGTVLLAPRISHVLFAVFAVSTAAAILGLLFFGDFTRKARIKGWLVPQQGLVRIFAPQAGVISQLLAQEGADVHKGDPLIVLSTELQSEALGATRREIVRRLVSRRDSLLAERDLQEQLHVHRLEELNARLDALTDEQEHLHREIEIQRERLDLAEESALRQRQLRESGVVPVQRLQRAEEERLDQALKLRDLERIWSTTDRLRVTLQGELRDLPLKVQTQLAEIDRNVAALEQELAMAEAQRELVVPAPQNGTVTAIQAEPGGNANTTTPLLSIVPFDSKLEAQLFGPSRAIGFVRTGQRVLLRYQAFPYQKFGHYEGTVANVSRSAINPHELSQHLSGLTSLYGTNEPVYRITVSLESQTVTAYGEPMPLQPGMQLEADVLIERRRLFEWVLDPLFTITGKWRG